MNEQDELRDRAARLAYEIEVQHYGGYDWEAAKTGVGVGDGVDTIGFGVPADELDMAYEIADCIIALVEQDVARRLLNATFQRDVNEALQGVVADGWLQQVFAAGLEHIGITAEEEE